MFSRILSVSRNYLARSVHKIATQSDSTQLIKLSDSGATTNVHLRLHLQEYSKDRIVSFHEIDKRIRKEAGKSFSEFHAEFLSCLSSASSVELRNSAIRKLSFRLDGVPAFMAAYKIFLGKLTKKTNGQIFNAMLNEFLSNDSDSALNFFPVVMALEEKMQLSNEDALLIFENMNKLNWRFIAIIMCRAMDSEKGIWPLIRLMLSNDQKFLVETLSLLSSTFTFDDSMYIIANLNADELSAIVGKKNARKWQRQSARYPFKSCSKIN